MVTDKLKDHRNDREPLPEGEVLRLNDWAESAGWVLALFAGLAGGLLLFTDPAPDSNLSGPLRPLLGAVWFGLAFLAASGARSGLVIRSGGVEVRSRFRSSTFSWPDIDEFVLKQSIYRPSLRMKLKDGQELRVVGFGARSPEEANRAETMVAELNRRASEYENN